MLQLTRRQWALIGFGAIALLGLAIYKLRLATFLPNSNLVSDKPLKSPGTPEEQPIRLDVFIQIVDQTNNSGRPIVSISDPVFGEYYSGRSIQQWKANDYAGELDVKPGALTLSLEVYGLEDGAIDYCRAAYHIKSDLPKRDIAVQIVISPRNIITCKGVDLT